MYLFQRPIVTIGVIIVTLIIIFFRRKYEFTAWKLVVFVPILVDLGLIAEKVLYYLNYGSWGGNYFYGITILLPIFGIPLVLLLRMNYLRAYDFAAPLSVFLLAFGKLNCMQEGCCTGKALFELSNGEIFYFPSRSAELIFALAMTVFFIWMNNNKKYHGQIYGYYCIIYAVQRIFFEEMRIEEAPTRFGLPVAEFWSIFIIFMGIAWILLVGQYKKKSKRWNNYVERRELAEIAYAQELTQKKKERKKQQQKAKNRN